jgi:hypothetical protein
MPGAISSRRRLTVVAVLVALVAAGVVASTVTANASVQNPGSVTVTVNAATLSTPMGDFAPIEGTLSGAVSGDGALTFPQASIAFTSFDATITNPVALTVNVTPLASSDFTGTVDPDTGSVTLTGDLTLAISLAQFGLSGCPLGPMSLDLSTANPGGSAYSAGAATVTDQSFVMPLIPDGAPGCAGAEGIIDTLVPLPTAPGASTLTMPLTFDPILTGASSTSSTNTTSTTTTTTTTTSSTTTTTTTTVPTTTTTVGTPAVCKSGNGFGDTNHCHTGAPGQNGAGSCDALSPTASLTGPLPAPTGRPDATVGVDLDHSVGPVNTGLTGVVWNSGSSIAPVQAVHPQIVRIDGSLQDRSQGPNQLDLTPLLQRVAQVRAIGAEPMVILSYMPRWLGAPRAGTTKDPTRVAPYDLDLWQSLVTTVVRTLATAPQPAYMFEVWNEPDQSIFWQDTSDAFTAMALRTHQAVADVKRETGLPLQIGGPAAAIGLNPAMLQYLHSVAVAHLPLDFVSWHKYANTPFLGPDGPEGNLPPEIYNTLAKRNPNSTPLDYSKEITDVRTKVDVALAGSGLAPKLIIDEWNVSAGGYDVRHDDAEGASLVAGILIEMERAGLDEAAFYRAISGSANHIGDWGLTYSDGTPKPSWWVFRAWSLMAGNRLPTVGDTPDTGLWARATSDGDCVNVLLTNFVATGAPARTVQVDLTGSLPRCRGPLTTTLATLDGASTSLASAHVLQVGPHNTFAIRMASQSVALIRTGCAS